MNMSQLGHENLDAYPELRDSLFYDRSGQDFLDMDEW